MRCVCCSWGTAFAQNVGVTCATVLRPAYYRLDSVPQYIYAAYLEKMKSSGIARVL